MDAVVLLGGEGTRLRPLTYDIPKQMLPVVDRPMVEHVVEWLVPRGVTRVVLSLGYRPDAFLRAFPGDEVAGARLHYAVEPALLDTAGAIAYAAGSAGVSDTFLVVNGDVLSDFDVSRLVAFHRERQARATIQLTPVADPSAFGVVPTDPSGRVEAFIEKPAPGTAPTNLVNAGCYVVEPEVLDMIPSGRRVSIEREIFPGLVEKGALYALASDAYWLDTGTPEKFLQASFDVLRGRRTPRSLPGVPMAASGLFVAEDAEVDGVLEPASYVGPKARVAAGAELSGSVLSAGAVLERGARVSGSMVMEGARIEPGAVVESSIIGPGAVVGESSKVTGFSVVGCGAEVPDGARLEAARFPTT